MPMIAPIASEIVTLGWSMDFDEAIVTGIPHATARSPAATAVTMRLITALTS